MNMQFSAIFQGRKIAATALAFGMVIGANRASAQDGGLPVGTMAPAAAVQMMDGSAANLSQFYGKKPVVMEFWATWCPLCKAMEPQFKASQAKHGDNVMFVNVGVPTNQTREREQQYITANSLGGTFVFDSAGNAMSAYKVPHTSHILVIDTKGMIVYNGVGKTQDLEAAIDKAMGMMKH
ncbi:MAG: TlpA disulfide reductase family protein [Gemmatimonadaceae bacterium]